MAKIPTSSRLRPFPNQVEPEKKKAVPPTPPAPEAPKAGTIIIQRGDALGAIALKNNTTVSELLQANPQIKNPDLIFAGDALNLPSAKPAPSAVAVPPPVRVLPAPPPVAPVQPTPTPTPTAPPVEEIVISEEEKKIERDAAAEEANRTAEKIFEEMKGKDIDVRESTKLLEELQKVREEEEEVVEPPSLTELFEEKRKELGLDVLESQLDEIESEMERIRGETIVGAQRLGELDISAGAISGRRAVLTREANQRLALLSLEQSALARSISTKQNTIKMIIDLTDTDFDNASKFYQDKFDNAKDIYNLINDREEDEKTHQERATDDARANLTIINNLLKSGRIDFEGLTDEQKRTIEEMETQAGYPIGFTSQILAEPDKSIKSTVSRTDAAGNTFFDVLMVDREGRLSVKTIARGVTGVEDSIDVMTDAEVDSLVTAALAGKEGKPNDPNLVISAIRLGTLKINELKVNFTDGQKRQLIDEINRRAGITETGEPEPEGVIQSDIDYANELIKLNPNESEEVVRAGIKENTNLSDEEIDSLFVGEEVEEKGATKKIFDFLFGISIPGLLIEKLKTGS